MAVCVWLDSKNFSPKHGDRTHWDIENLFWWKIRHTKAAWVMSVGMGRVGVF